MNIPNLATSKLLASIARQDDNMAMRVILRRVSNTGAYTVHGRVRKYVFEYNPKVGAHVLDVPLSVWCAGLQQGSYADNPSIAHDIQASRSSHLAPLVIIPIPFGNGAVPAAVVIAPNEDASLNKSLAVFERLLDKLNAPSEIMEAMQILRMDDIEDAKKAEALRMLCNSISVEDEYPTYAEPPDAPEEAAAVIPPPITLQDTSEEEKRRKNADKVRRHRAKKRAIAKELDAKKTSKPSKALV